MYKFVSNLIECTPSLKRLTYLLNLPVKLTMHAEKSEHVHRQSEHLYARLAPQAPHHFNFCEKLPICVSDVSFDYKTFRLSRVSEDLARQSHHNYQGNLEVSQGELVQLIGPNDEGKTVLLKLISGVLVPELSQDLRQTCKEDLSFFIPPHLNAIFVPSQHLFFRGSLLGNLTLGLQRGCDGSIERVAKVCQRCGLDELLASFPLTDSRASWLHEMTHTQASLLGVARALVANPRLLCIEKHWMCLDTPVSNALVLLLREHVDKRGIEQDYEAAGQEVGRLRRPRTCFMTGRERDTYEDAFVDRIFGVSHARGIELLHAKTM